VSDQLNEQQANIRPEFLEKMVLDGMASNKLPYKLVTGTQTTTGLNFDIKPGAIVAHPGSTVVFVCG
jgi:hypothetical protein